MNRNVIKKVSGFELEIEDYKKLIDIKNYYSKKIIDDISIRELFVILINSEWEKIREE